MQTPLQITVRNLPHSIALDMHIRDKASRLKEYFSPIIACHVLVDVPLRHQSKSRQVNVRIELSVPRQEIFVNLDHHEDVYVALREAFDSAMRLLDEYAHRQRRVSAGNGSDPMYEVGEVGSIA